MDCADLAAWFGKFAESESVAVVPDFVGTRAAGTWLCDLSIPSKHLADRTGRRRLVFLWPQYGGKNGDAGSCRFVVGRSRADSARAYVGGATRHVDVRHRGPDPTWHIAVMGIVYSYITAAAMWQNFRARLPYLYDPWSEEIPPPPTLMHAMIAISILVEGGAVLTGIFLGIFGRENIAIAQAMSYGISAVVVSFGMSRFLAHRDVYGRDVWSWREDGAVEESSETSWKLDRIWKSNLPQGLLLGVVGGAGLGLFAHGYLAVLQHIPAAAEVLHKSQEEMAKIPDLRISFGVMAILFAPFAEEYLFRGLLYRALDREWGGWRAVLGSAAFFAIYHSPYSWLPVATVGAANALLFKKTRHLAPAVALHMVYNTVVTLWK